MRPRTGLKSGRNRQNQPGFFAFCGDCKNIYKSKPGKVGLRLAEATHFNHLAESKAVPSPYFNHRRNTPLLRLRFRNWKKKSKCASQPQQGTSIDEKRSFSFGWGRETLLCKKLRVSKPVVIFISKVFIFISRDMHQNQMFFLIC